MLYKNWVLKKVNSENIRFVTGESAMGIIPSSSELTQKEKLYRNAFAKAVANRDTAKPTL